jgi:hypothetical protein
MIASLLATLVCSCRTEQSGGGGAQPPTLIAASPQVVVVLLLYFFLCINVCIDDNDVFVCCVFCVFCFLETAAVATVGSSCSDSLETARYYFVVVVVCSSLFLIMFSYRLALWLRDGVAVDACTAVLCHWAWQVSRRTFTTLHHNLTTTTTTIGSTSNTTIIDVGARRH